MDKYRTFDNDIYSLINLVDSSNIPLLGTNQTTTIHSEVRHNKTYHYLSLKNHLIFNNNIRTIAMAFRIPNFDNSILTANHKNRYVYMFTYTNELSSQLDTDDYYDSSLAVVDKYNTGVPILNFMEDLPGDNQTYLKAINWNYSLGVGNVSGLREDAFGATSRYHDISGKIVILVAKVDQFDNIDNFDNIYFNAMAKLEVFNPSDYDVMHQYRHFYVLRLDQLIVI